EVVRVMVDRMHHAGVELDQHAVGPALLPVAPELRDMRAFHWTVFPLDCIRRPGDVAAFASGSSRSAHREQRHSSKRRYESRFLVHGETPDSFHRMVGSRNARPGAGIASTLRRMSR